MSQVPRTDPEKGESSNGLMPKLAAEDETTYFFDQHGEPIASDRFINSKSDQKPGQITSFVPDLLEPPHYPPKNSTKPDNDEEEEGNFCGIGSWRPDWLQKFASKKAFMVVFSLLAIIQSMCWSYFTATITTLEKRFKISSQTAGK